MCPIVYACFHLKISVALFHSLRECMCESRTLCADQTTMLTRRPKMYQCKMDFVQEQSFSSAKKYPIDLNVYRSMSRSTEMQENKGVSIRRSLSFQKTLFFYSRRRLWALIVRLAVAPGACLRDHCLGWCIFWPKYCWFEVGSSHENPCPWSWCGAARYQTSTSKRIVAFKRMLEWLMVLAAKFGRTYAQPRSE